MRPFPGPGGKWRVALGGGSYPRWSTTARSKVMVAPYDVTGDSFRVDKPQNWSPATIRGSRVGNSAYDLHPDGKRLAIVGGQDQGSGGQDKVVVVFNFFDELRRTAPQKK